ncbi:TonB-dependent receptor [Polymorphobacter fuscus]|uniref:TonB-dependent receptor n=1 Tax=Sandarakinorhabdus fusca TaxID=1439888 RepID=A0A7C9GQT7_9SPHN|nr:TonB-dependent receptor [Polymorphobacter fuscus]KAB7643629.1 TonB-dependent receptor [Polymorphobacter fuscus]MQT18712.1 TonB-dependent receptor [Polymorphobacter fuscus]NJC09600.1 TonB-dependent receptor [Polymorphobacter fuscus]
MTPRNRFARRTIQLLGCTSLSVLAVSAARAQDAAPAPNPATAVAAPAAGNPEEEILVTGYRASLAGALNDKRLSIGIVDVIRAEDIADFPDNNLAESIQRIPGVTITRDQGEGRNITVRGLGPTFTRVRINGIEGLSTTGGADASGGANRSRSFDFNVFASELFNSITVRKSASADVEEGSLGATVDLVTARPFDYKDDMTVAGSAQVGINDFSNAINPKLAALISKKFADGKIGVLVSAAYSERGIAEEGPSTVRWERGTDNAPAGGRPTGAFAPGSTLPNGAQQGYGFFAPRIPRYDSYRYDTKRLGLTGSLQFAPTDATLLSFDALYATFKSNRSEQYLEAISFSRGAGGKQDTVILPGAVVDSNNSLVSGRFNNVDVRVESRYDELETKFQQYTGSLHQEFGDRVRLDLLGGYSKSAFSNPIQTTVALDANNVQGYSYDFSSRAPTFNYGNLDVTDPTRFTLAEVRLRPQYVDNDFKVGRAQLEFDATDTLKLRVGGDWKKYGYSSQEFRRTSETDVAGLIAPGQLPGLTSIYSFSPNTALGGSPAGFVVPNIDAMASTLGFYSNTGKFALTGITNASARGSFTTVGERSLGGFGQIVYSGEIGSMRVRGDAGVRYVDTRQTSTGYQNTPTAPGFQLIEVTRNYGNWLPSANLSVDVTDEIILRAAVARVMARPNIGTVNPGGSFSISGGNRTLSLGNPFVDPTKAWDYNLGAEWYFAKGAALTVGLFYKDINSFVATTTQQIPFNQLGLPDTLLAGTNVAPTDLFTVTQPANSKGGTLKGLEVGLQTPFSFLPAGWSNFGVQVNYTYVDSKIEYPLATAAGAPVIIQPLVNLSKHSANGTLYYEDDVFSIRGSVAYRSGYLTNVPGRNGVAPGAGPVFNANSGQPTFNDVEGVKGTVNVDMSASVKFNEAISLTFEAINLTDQYIDQYIDSAADRLSVYHHTGRQFYFGVRFKY